MNRESRLHEYLFSRVAVGITGCWDWLGTVDQKGYGRVNMDRKTLPAHRVMYNEFVAELRPEDSIHHVCRNKVCVNPRHLMKMKRSSHQSMHNPLRTHCKHGHRWTEDNTYWRYDNKQSCWKRECRACQRRKVSVRYWSKKLQKEAI